MHQQTTPPHPHILNNTQSLPKTPYTNFDNTPTQHRLHTYTSQPPPKFLADTNLANTKATKNGTAYLHTRKPRYTHRLKPHLTNHMHWVCKRIQPKMKHGLRNHLQYRLLNAINPSYTHNLSWKSIHGALYRDTNTC